MFGFVGKRVLHGLVSIIGASILIFVISRLSGDPIVLMLPVEAPPEVIEATRREIAAADADWGRARG